MYCLHIPKERVVVELYLKISNYRDGDHLRDCLGNFLKAADVPFLPFRTEGDNVIIELHADGHKFIDSLSDTFKAQVEISDHGLLYLVHPEVLHIVEIDLSPAKSRSFMLAGPCAQ